MKRLLFWTFILLFTLFWVSVVYKTCNKVTNDTKTTAGSAIDNTLDKVGINSDNEEDIKDEDEEDILADLIDEEDDRSTNAGEADGEGEGEADGETDGNNDETDSDSDRPNSSSTTGKRIDLDDDDDSSDNISTTSSSSSTNINNNRYMVLAGSFRSIENAKIEAKRLRKKGYTEAEIVKFDFSNLHTICVARYRDLGDARYLTKKLKREDKIEAYVHRRRSKRGL